MTKTKEKLSDEDTWKLLFIADKYLVTGKVLDKILEMFAQLILEQPTQLPVNFKNTYIWLAMEKFITSNDQFPIKIIENEVELKGLDVTPETKARTFKLLNVFSEHYTGIRIKNFPLDL